MWQKTQHKNRKRCELKSCNKHIVTLDQISERPESEEKKDEIKSGSTNRWERPKEDDTGQQTEEMLRNKVGGKKRGLGSTFRGKERSRLYLEKDVFTQQISHHYTSLLLSGEGGTDWQRREGRKEQITSVFVRWRRYWRVAWGERKSE